MDLNTGLTQALSDGTNHYIYGLGRIAQVNTTTEYFLGDALGSVRQLTDASGEITYSRAYDPYGVVSSTGGTSQSAYGYTGESYGDSTELLYLRSRFYASGTGRFLTRDTWSGNANMPMSYNRWSYGYGNPVNLTDPTGQFPAECLEADDFAQCLRDWAAEGRGGCATDPVSLTQVGDLVPGTNETMIYGGDQFAKLYELMDSATTGTWWNQDGNFTFEQFVGLLLMHEGAGNYLFSMLDAFAGAQQLYVGGGASGAYGPY
jgi:RHS repeat-associated protein